MMSVPLGASPLTVSQIGMGCVTFGREIDETSSFKILDHAFERGITLYDTAAAYAEGESERVLGSWLTKRPHRQELVVATKVHGVLTKQHVVASAEASLGRLRTDVIDLFQLHHWDDKTPLDETWAGLEQLLAQGKVRAVGCSNWIAWQLAKSLIMLAPEQRHSMSAIQPPYNLVQRDIETDVLPLCADQNLGVLSYSPLAAGFLTGKYGRGETIPPGTRFDVIPGHQPIYFNPTGFAALDRLQQVSKTEGKPLAHLALAWVFRQPAITSVLIGARHVDQIEQAFDALNDNLDDSVVQQLSGTVAT